MAYSELMKDFNRIRAYLREFYVYGFRSRDAFNASSARSYDNERRRVESWLGPYMHFRQDETGKQVFLSMDSRALAHNPMYKAFKAKSFTDTDIVFHFCLLDMLAGGRSLTSREVTDRLVSNYMAPVGAELVPDESTIRKKLKEYEGLGLLHAQKRGRMLYYRLSPCTTDLSAWQDALAFFTENAPGGAIGAPLLEDESSPFGFKHRYLLGALDTEVLLMLLESMNSGQAVELTVFSRRRNTERKHTLFPVRLYVSTQTGRQYLFGYHYRQHRPVSFRLDSIRTVKAVGVETKAARYQEECIRYAAGMWGVSTGRSHQLEHFEMDIHATPEEDFIPQRLHREGRQGTVTQLDEQTWRFSIDVYDTLEMLPWVRSFIGRIVRVEGSNAQVLHMLQQDIQAMGRMYGGDAP